MAFQNYKLVCMTCEHELTKSRNMQTTMQILTLNITLFSKTSYDANVMMTFTKQEKTWMLELYIVCTFITIVRGRG